MQNIRDPNEILRGTPCKGFGLGWLWFGLALVCVGLAEAMKTVKPQRAKNKNIGDGNPQIQPKILTSQAPQPKKETQIL